ncbi:MAG: substrate-binding domain-containing protein [Spirochaetales bacterium]
MRIRPEKETRKRKRIAFMLASIHSGASTKVWPQILDESEKRQCALFVFPGGRLASHDEYEYMRNGIFDLVSACSFDGAISWASSLSGFASEKQVEDFHLSRIDIPLVTFGLKIGGMPVVNIDAYTGMKRLVSHLARRHSCRKIAFIGGPKAHSSAEERYKAYRDALDEAGLRFDCRLASLDNAWDEGGKAMAQLLDENSLKPGVDFDAFCAASDLLAFEAAKLLQERGFRIPADIAMGGFNDSDESNLLSPTYTTVRMPFERQALQAFHMLIEKLDGREPADKVLKTRLVIRQSCGCLTESVHRAGLSSSSRWRRPEGEETPPPEDALLRFISGIAGFPPDETERCLRPIVSSFLVSLANRKRGSFINTLDAILNDFIFQDREIEAFQDILSALRLACGTYAASIASSETLETLIGQARVLVSDAGKRISNYHAWKEKSVDHWLNVLNHELLCAKDFESIIKTAGRYLPELDIDAGYFVLNGKSPESRNFAGGFELRAGGQGIEKKLDFKQAQKNFPSKLILPKEVYPAGKGSYIVLPLYYESTSMGYAVLRLKRKDASIYEEIRAQLSSAMRGVLLFEQVNEARRRAEKAEKIKTEFLAGISGELQEPIDFIHDTATKLLADGGLRHREEIEAIVSHSSRQSELTRHLLDLSLAEVDDLSIPMGLFNPRIFVERFVATAGTKQKKKKWAALACAAFPGFIPLALGDSARLGQVLEIFLDCAFRDLGIQTAEIAIRISPEGIGFRIRGRLGVAGAREKAKELRSILAIGPGLASLDRMKIEMELAKRIAFLHGGSLASAESDGEFEFGLLLPYPSLEAAPRLETLEKKTSAIGFIGECLPTPLQCIFLGWEAKKIGIAEAGGADPSKESPPLIYVDPASMDAQESVALGLVLENVGFRKMRFVVNASCLAGEPAAKPQSLPDFLQSFAQAKASTTILLLEASDHAVDEAALLFDAQLKEGARLLRCGNPEELGVLMRRETPHLVVLSGQRKDLAEILATSQEYANIPLLCLSGAFDDPPFGRLLAERPKTAFCNSGHVFRGIIREEVSRLLGGEELLPAQTGSSIMKAIFFLNKHFREQVSRWKLSEHLNVSEDYLSRIFHKQMGIPLWEYLNRLRIGYAIDLLRNTADSVAEIASRSGFQDQAYFCRVFRRIVGLTPGAARKVKRGDVRKVQESD